LTANSLFASTILDIPSVFACVIGSSGIMMGSSGDGVSYSVLHPDRIILNETIMIKIDGIEICFLSI